MSETGELSVVAAVSRLRERLGRLRGWEVCDLAVRAQVARSTIYDVRRGRDATDATLRALEAGLSAMVEGGVIEGGLEALDARELRGQGIVVAMEDE